MIWQNVVLIAEVGWFVHAYGLTVRARRRAGRSLAGSILPSSPRKQPKLPSVTEVA